MSLPTIRTIMDRIPEIDLYQVGLRALASIKHHSDPKQSRKIAMLIVVSSLWAVHSSNPDLDAKAPDGTTLNAFRHKGLSDDEVWIAMGEALAVILSQGVGHLKETVALIMEHVKPGLGVDLLAPMFLRLDDTEKEALMDEATQAISNLVDRNSLPDLDLVGSDAM